MDFKSIAEKKVFNIPVLYIAAAVALGFLYYAWKMKSNSSAESDVPVDAGGESDAAGVNEAADYSGLNTQGTVTVVQGTAADAEDSVQPTNEDWSRSVIDWLIKNKKATATEAQSAVDHYLAGQDLSYDESQLINSAIASSEIGQPPEKVAIGNVGTVAPAQKQFSNFPGKHTVKGSNDNSAAKLAALYYGVSDAAHVNLITAYNSGRGPSTGTYNAGDVITIPAWSTPVYVIASVSNGVRASTIAAKNGTSRAKILALNPGVSEPYVKGAKIRVA